MSIFSGIRKRGLHRGQAMVEFVYALPILLLMIAGIVEFGRLMAIHSMINAASREAARFAASAGDSGIGTPNHYEDCAGIIDAAVRVSEPLLAVNPGNVLIWYDGDPTKNCPQTVVGLGTRITVSVSATYQPIVPLVPIGPMTISSETSRTLLTDIDVTP